MIHVAPCQCELHVRIRELEAELAEEHRQNVRNLARAEHAEAELAEMRQWEIEAGERVRDIEFYKARAERAEARVAELTEHLAVGHECTCRFHTERVGDETPSQVVREREATPECPHDDWGQDES